MLGLRAVVLIGSPLMTIVVVGCERCAAPRSVADGRRLLGTNSTRPIKRGRINEPEPPPSLVSLEHGTRHVGERTAAEEELVGVTSAVCVDVHVLTGDRGRLAVRVFG